MIMQESTFISMQHLGLRIDINVQYTETHTNIHIQRNITCYSSPFGIFTYRSHVFLNLFIIHICPNYVFYPTLNDVLATSRTGGVSYIESALGEVRLASESTNNCIHFSMTLYLGIIM